MSKRPSTDLPSPADLLRDPNVKLGDISDLPDSWKGALEQSTHWPYVDPDEALEMPEEELKEKAQSVPASPDADVEITPYTASQPWGKMDVETERQYELFAYFRSLGHGRTRTQVARHFEVSAAYISQVASEKGWDDRIEAWDRYKETVYAQEVIEGVREMARVHAEIARDGIEALSKPFKVLLRKLESEEGTLELETMNISALIKLVQRSSQILPNLMNAERLSRGMPTEISETTINENKTIRLESSDELAELIYGLATALPGLGDDGSEEYLEVEFEEETVDDDARRAIASSAASHTED